MCTRPQLRHEICGPLDCAETDIVMASTFPAPCWNRRASWVYRELIHADLGEFLAATTPRLDLIVA